MTILKIKRKVIPLVCIYLLIFSCKNESIFGVSLYPRITNADNYALYLNKIRTHLPVKIACEGTSLTYGENVPGPLPPINGATQTRAIYQYPETLQTTLLSKGINANVINRGYPGDRTTDGLVRWQDSTIADVCIIEYGTNDVYNFADYASGNLTVNAFSDSLSKIVERRLNQKAWVIITSPPQLNPHDSSLDSYSQTIQIIAVKYGLPVFDVEKSVIEGKNDYFDRVHLTATAYKNWGITIARLLYTGN